jgi:stringent starvation protein B
MSEVSTKPYLIRAIHEWCIDSGLTPYIAVLADDKVQVPREFVKNGEIVLNISPLATNRLSLGNEFIEFQARFGGVGRDVSVPVEKVIAVYARENGQGMAFDVPRTTAADAQRPEPSLPLALTPMQGKSSAETNEPVEPPPPPRAGDRPKLTRIK